MPAVRPGRTLLRAERKLLTLQAEAAFLAWAGKGCQLRADSQSKVGPCEPSAWRVQPELQAIEAEGHSARAVFYFPKLLLVVSISWE